MINFAPTKYVALVKSYTVPASSRYNYYAYTPISSDGMWWVNWKMYSRQNPSVSGSIRLILAKLAKLCKSTRYYLPFNDAARSAGWATVTPNTINDIDGVYCSNGNLGETVTYTVVVPAGGRIAYEWIRTTVSTTEAYVVIRIAGVEIDAGKYDVPLDGANHRYVDMAYAANNYNEIARTSLASNLGGGTYTVQITASGIVGVGGGRRIYERYCFAIDDTLPGDPTGTDPWMDQDSPSAVIGTSGNVEYACRMGQAGAPYADLDYASGTHGYESVPSALSLLVDGTDIKASFDLAATYQGTKWFGRAISVQYSTTLQTRVGLVDQATLGWQHLFTPAGYDCNLLRTTLIATDYNQEYVGMIMCPNLPNGGANHMYVGGQYYTVGTVTPPVQVSYTPAANRMGAVVGSGWRSSVYVAAPSDLEAVLPHANQSSPKTLITDRTDGFIKDYRAFVFAQSGMVVPVVSGDMCGAQLQFRVHKV